MSDFMEAMKAAIGDNSRPTAVEQWLNTGHPLLNDAISGSYHGGMPSGRIVEMMGGPSAGKTAIATQVMIAAQKAGGVAAFMDHENSFDVGLAIAGGLNDTSRWIFKAPDTFEQSVALTIKAAIAIREKKLVAPDAPVVFVFDSLASMVPKSKFEKGVEDYNMNDTTALARATSAVFPALAKWCEKLNFLALFLNQLRTKPGVSYGDPETTPGGSAPEFYASVRIKLRRSKKTKGAGEDKVVTGQTVTAEVVKNKVHRPFEKAKWDMLFTEDGQMRFDQVGSVIDLLLDKEILVKKGHRIEWDGKSLYRDDIAERIEASGDRLQLYKLLPGWDEDAASAPQKVEWNL